MGTRTFVMMECPGCGDEDFYIYDAPSSLLWVGVCDVCGYQEPGRYIERCQNCGTDHSDESIVERCPEECWEIVFVDGKE